MQNHTQLSYYKPKTSTTYKYYILTENTAIRRFGCYMFSLDVSLDVLSSGSIRNAYMLYLLQVMSICSAKDSYQFRSRRLAVQEASQHLHELEFCFEKQSYRPLDQHQHRYIRLFARETKREHTSCILIQMTVERLSIDLRKRCSADKITCQAHS